MVGADALRNLRSRQCGNVGTAQGTQLARAQGRNLRSREGDHLVGAQYGDIRAGERGDIGHAQACMDLGRGQGLDLCT